MIHLIQQLCELSTAVLHSDGTMIIKEGDTENLCMYIVLQGNVDVVKNYGKWDQVVLTQLTAGDFFGEMSLFLSQPRKASVIAAGDVILLEINQDNVQEIIKGNPELLYGIAKTLCNRIEMLNEKIHA